MVLAGALERAGYSPSGGPKFTVKGGVALELRLRNIARATRDLDLILNAEGGDLLQELAGALAQAYEGFTFVIKGDAYLMPNQAVRAEVAIRYLGRAWDTVPVDVSRREGTGTEVEFVQVSLLDEFGIRSPESIPCLSLPFHVAQKIHAMTEPHTEERPNHRFRDLVDLLLLRQWVTDMLPLQAACKTVFSLRGTHPWPPLVQAHDHWIAPFAYLAESVGLSTRDIHQAVREAREFLYEIDAASPSS
jgi:hypothetical protein